MDGEEYFLTPLVERAAQDVLSAATTGREMCGLLRPVIVLALGVSPALAADPPLPLGPGCEW